ncbi:carbohydrate ABC transporter substrate-binding protein, CUT1 family [Caloramator quimbayensis]|uniref:Carbohydrate ABC transporter substrate-binding protein, CUT1 family n=1 Tax=Caloramator quimbayensis TaxID=1147123 RepID=A0A1T4Y6L5_9CLOT|nr:extracellular solute-binding protein [Caloramator quimbayensis]SKA97303.1 carbohydrate ABC transporter substrate-binding protein, CUT1 family [Caloramator quimbayensis]
MNYKKITVLLLSFIMALSLFAGCGKKESGPATLRITMGLGEEEWKVMREDVFPAFEKANNCKIEAVQIEASDVVKKLEAMKQANKMDIDLIAQDNMALAPLVDKGLVEDISEFKNKIPSEIIPSLISVGEFDGKLYFFPFRPNVEINFYNEAKLNQYGLKPPANWDELFNLAKTLKEKEGVGKVGIKAVFDGNTTVQLFEFIRQAGGDPLVLNDEGSVRAYTFLKELWPYLSFDSLKADWNTTNRFLAEESMYLAANWPFGVNVIVKDGGKKEIKAYGGFSGPVKASKVLGGDVLGIPKGSPNKELALKFIEYLMSKDVQETLASKLAWPSARTDAYAKVEDWQKPYFDAINEAMKVAQPRPNLVYWADVDKALNDALKEIVVDGKDVKATLDKYHQKIEEAKQNSSK